MHTVELELFNDDATGHWGFAPKGTTEGNYPFDSFYNGIGMFHDVFEHWFENKHKYFKDDKAMNVGGEICAMGCAMYYYETLGVSNRPLSTYHTFSTSAMSTTLDMIQESIKYGYSTFGHTLESGVPRQRTTECGELEYMIKKYIEKLQQTEVGKTNYAEEKEDCFTYANSITNEKIINLHRYGYRMAQRIVPNNPHNTGVLYNFIQFWDEFCKRIKADDLQYYFSGIKFNISKHRGDIKWTAYLVGKFNYPNMRITTETEYEEHLNNKYFYKF